MNERWLAMIGTNALRRTLVTAAITLGGWGCSSTTPPGVDATARPDGGGDVGEVPPPPLPEVAVVITQPLGPRATVATERLELGGVLGGEVTSLRYSVERPGLAGLSGAVEPSATWSVKDLALGAGDNRVSVVARPKEGAEVSDTITVTCNPGLRLEAPVVSPDELFVGDPGTVKVSLLVLDRSAVVADSVKVHAVDEKGVVQGAALATLRDDGAGGDERAKDGRFTGTFTVDTSQARTGLYRLALRYEDEEGEERDGRSTVFSIRAFARISDEQVTRYEAVGERAYELYATELAARGDKASAMTAVAAALAKMPGVESAGADPTGYSLSWTMDWGMLGNFRDAPDGGKGGGQPVAEASAILLEPFATEFGAYAEAVATEKLLRLCACPTVAPIDIHLDASATLDKFRVMHRYGVVFIDSHGGVDRKGRLYIGLEQLIDWKQRDDPQNPMGKDANAHRVGGIVDYKSPKVDGRHPGKFVIYPAFVSYYSRPMVKNSVVYSGACYSFANRSFASAFLANGAGAFMAYTGWVSNAWAFLVANGLFEELRRGRMVKEAVAAVRAKLGWTDPSKPSTYFAVLPWTSPSQITSDGCDGYTRIEDLASFEDGTYGGWVTGHTSFFSIDRIGPTLQPNTYALYWAVKTCTHNLQRTTPDGKIRDLETGSGYLSEEYADPTKLNLDPDRRGQVTKLIVDPVARTAQISLVPEGARYSQDDWVSLSTWQIALGSSSGQGPCPFEGAVGALLEYTQLSDEVIKVSNVEITAQRIKGHAVIHNQKGSATVDFDYALRP